jgi:hypothetical protein
VRIECEDTKGKPTILTIRVDFIGGNPRIVVELSPTQEAGPRPSVALTVVEARALAEAIKASSE